MPTGEGRSADQQYMMAGVSQDRVAELVEETRTGSERAAAAAPELSDVPGDGTSGAKADSYVEAAKHAGRAVTGKFAECAAAAKEYAAQTKDAAIRTAEDAASAVRHRGAGFTSSAKETGSLTSPATKESTTKESTTARHETSAVQEKAGEPAAGGVDDATLAGKGRAASLAAKEYVMETIRGAQAKFGRIAQSGGERASHGKETAAEVVVPAHKEEEEETVEPTVKDTAAALVADGKDRTAEQTTNAKNRAADASIDREGPITSAAAARNGADETMTPRASEESRTPGAYVESAKGAVAGVVNRIGRKAHQVYDNLSGRTLSDTRGVEPLLPKEEATNAKTTALEHDTSRASAGRQLLQLTS